MTKRSRQAPQTASEAGGSLRSPARTLGQNTAENCLTATYRRSSSLKDGLGLPFSFDTRPSGDNHDCCRPASGRVCRSGQAGMTHSAGWHVSRPPDRDGARQMNDRTVRCAFATYTRARMPRPWRPRGKPPSRLPVQMPGATSSLRSKTAAASLSAACPRCLARREYSVTKACASASRFHWRPGRAGRDWGADAKRLDPDQPVPRGRSGGLQETRCQMRHMAPGGGSRDCVRIFIRRHSAGASKLTTSCSGRRGVADTGA
jgi:hypothetical protein